MHESRFTWWPGRHLMSAHLIELNDRIWGQGNWVQCYHCPRDTNGHGVFHHRNAHS